MTEHRTAADLADLEDQRMNLNAAAELAGETAGEFEHMAIMVQGEHQATVGVAASYLRDLQTELEDAALELEDDR